MSALGDDRCSVCWLPVSKRPENEHKRVRRDDGGYDHRACVQRPRTSEERRLEAIFGNAAGVRSRRRVFADEEARAIGHVTTLETIAGGVMWRCTCGMTGYGEPRDDRSACNESAREHKRWVAINRPESR